jgi:translation initiation factor 4E
MSGTETAARQVLDDATAQPTSENKTHPLQEQWTMWYSKTNTEWNPQPITDFNTVEGFWRLYNNLIPAGSLPDGADYFMFKKSIKPEWEDPMNVNGGVWMLEFAPNASDSVNNCWLWTLLALIGEYFSESGDISGAVVSARPRQVRLSLWTQTASDEAKQSAIAQEWYESFTAENGYIVDPPVFKQHSRK